MSLADREFIVTRTFAAPREMVWRAHSEAAHLARWWGPKGFSLHVARFEFVPGGIFHYGMRSAAGDEMWGKFVYLAIDKPDRIEFISSFADAYGATIRNPWSATWPLEIMNRLTFTAQGAQTSLVLRGGPHNATDQEWATFEGAAGSIQHGFKGTFDQLDDYLSAIESAGLL